MKVLPLIALAIQSRSKIRSEVQGSLTMHVLGFGHPGAGCLLQRVWDWTVLMNTEDSGHTWLCKSWISLSWGTAGNVIIFIECECTHHNYYLIYPVTVLKCNHTLHYPQFSSLLHLRMQNLRVIVWFPHTVALNYGQAQVLCPVLVIS